MKTLRALVAATALLWAAAAPAAKIHILQCSPGNRCNAVVHSTTPAGNNAVGVSWVTALKNAGLQAASVMPIGTGAGQITTSESNSVVAGSILEATFVWEYNPAWTVTERNADLSLRAQQAVDAMIADYQVRLNMFGATAN